MLRDIPIPRHVMQRVDAGITAGMQAELIELLTGLSPGLQTPSTLGGLIRSVEAQKLITKATAKPKARKEPAHAPA